MLMPLQGIRVIDWTENMQGPLGTSILGALGADVIKVEERTRGDQQRGHMWFLGVPLGLPTGTSAFFESHNRNKRGVAIDLKKPKGQEIIYELVQKADVFVQNLRVGVAQKLKLDYKTLSQYNPQLIYVNGTGYGPKGPESRTPSMDLCALARSGMMYMVGDPGDEPGMPIGAMADEAGANVLAFSVVTALLARERLGVGQEVDVSIYGSMVSMLRLRLAFYMLTGRSFQRLRRQDMINPLYNYYRCKDGRWIAISLIFSERYWHDFCEAVGIQPLEHDPKFQNQDRRQENHEELIAILDRVIGSRNYAEWDAIFREKDFLFAPVNRIEDVAEDPQAVENDLIVDFDSPKFGRYKVVGLPIRFSKTPWAVRSETPELGQHTEEILLELGHSWEDILALRDEEVIA